ncbi:MAG: alpha/beta-type small acid-soluble spore protein [Peptococcaceae bacterium]|jgi:small acid-soluble spore protein D (minor alpha/beta-type SASP)|nr:alpha/beta-type small acid-soluble spore protein [Peptococcaceae bacterium]
MARRRSNPVLDRLKYEVSNELGYINANPQDFNYEFSEELGISSASGINNVQKQYSDFLNNSKFEIASELGIPLNHGYNGDLTSRDAGRIGGRLGGKIGGNMVKRMVEFAQNHMKNNGGQL